MMAICAVIFFVDLQVHFTHRHTHTYTYTDTHRDTQKVSESAGDVASNDVDTYASPPAISELLLFHPGVLMRLASVACIYLLAPEAQFLLVFANALLSTVHTTVDTTAVSCQTLYSYA